MKVKCIYNKLEDLSLSTREKIGIQLKSLYPMDIGEEFNVYGQLVDKKGIIHYLIIEHRMNRSYWFPSELFEIIDKSIPTNWYFTEVSNSNIIAIWGFYELVYDRDFFSKLMDRDYEAYKIFMKRIKETKAWFANGCDVFVYLSYWDYDPKTGMFLQ